jgi:predicted nucleic acid-binding protein
MKGYLLDTSVCVALFRGNRSVSKKLNEVGKDCCYVNDVVVAELIVGAYKSN